MSEKIWENWARREKAKEGLWLFRDSRIWHALWLVNLESSCEQSSVTDADEKWDIAVMWLTALYDFYISIRDINFVNLPFSFRSLDLSLLHTCLWRALHAGLLGPGSLMRTVCKYSMLLLNTDIIWGLCHIFLRPIFLQRLPLVDSRYRKNAVIFLSIHVNLLSRCLHSSRKEYLISLVGDLAFI